MLSWSGPNKGNLFEASAANALIPSYAFPSAQCLVETAGKVILGERPDQKRAKTIRTQIAPSFAKHALAEAKPLKLGPHVELVDFTAMSEASRPAGSECGIACDPVVEFEHKRPEA